MHLTTSPVDWYAARGAGIAAYLLLTIVVVLGMTLAGRARLRRWPRFALEDVHRFGGLLVGSFIAIHVVAIAIDAYLPFSLPAIAIPFVATYRPLFTALGIVAAELLLALAITNRYRDRLPYTFWRRAHYLNLAIWGAATLHGLGSGTDRSTPWLLALFAASVAAVLAAGVWRVLGRVAVPVRVGAHGCHRRGRRRGDGRLRGDRASALLAETLERQRVPGTDGREARARRRRDPGARLGHGDRPW